jgi:hypothetical protein
MHHVIITLLPTVDHPSDLLAPAPTTKYNLILHIVYQAISLGKTAIRMYTWM